MITKTEEKNLAVGLRRRGMTYREILEKVPVAKSTLSIWLSEVGLAKAQKQRITEKRLRAGLRGAKVRHQQRVELVKRIDEMAIKEVGRISVRELWLIGIALYWAEGSKEKERRPGIGVRFSNSDPQMVRLFLRWLFVAAHIPRNSVTFEIYIHEMYKKKVPNMRKYWASITKFPVSAFEKVYFKKNSLKTVRQNIGDSYFGQLRIKVEASSILNRKIAGWARGICEASFS